jgi:hypothetical protein
VASSSSRLGLDEPQATDAISGFPADDVEALGVLDNAVLYGEGTLAGRGSVTPLVAGFIYRATDTGDVSMHGGAGWIPLVRGSNVMTSGTGTFTWDGSSAQSPTAAVTHSIGRVPQFAMAVGNGSTSDAHGAAVFCNRNIGFDSTTQAGFIATAYDYTPAAGTTQPFYWIVTG